MRRGVLRRLLVPGIVALSVSLACTPAMARQKFDFVNNTDHALEISRNANGFFIGGSWKLLPNRSMTRSERGGACDFRLTHPQTGITLLLLASRVKSQQFDTHVSPAKDGLVLVARQQATTPLTSTKKNKDSRLTIIVTLELVESWLQKDPGATTSFYEESNPIEIHWIRERLRNKLPGNSAVTASVPAESRESPGLRS